MKGVRVFITGMGMVSPLGNGVSETMKSLVSRKKGIRPLSLFPVLHGAPLPVGEVPDRTGGDVAASEESGIILPRSHRLALAAANEALEGSPSPPDAIIIGSTTGGMLRTEELLKEKNSDPRSYSYHATGSIGEYLAQKTGCSGPVITVSTACSSGTAVLKLALDLIRSGRARSVLAGGVDSLCKLTYHGFNSLQLIDPEGARPFDKDRRGMSVAEAAGMLLLQGGETVPVSAVAELLGAGLSCDAHHPAAPHPEGDGAFRAMMAALNDAGLSAQDIDYISLHGTGTRENDSSEAKAVACLYLDGPPLLSSIKGATGHSLAAAGAIEAIVSCLCIRDGFVPGNIGFANHDPELSLVPTVQSRNTTVKSVLSNSFGFGGNNAVAVLSSASGEGNPSRSDVAPVFSVKGLSCFTGAGGIEKTLSALASGASVAGILPLDEISEKLPQRSVRRLKRLPRLALSLAVAARESAACETGPDCISFGTAWGALSETYDFLMKLYETDEEFTSPTDFVGSVHNAPAGQVAIWFKSTGPNMTVTGGDYSFEQALVTAGMTCRDNESLLAIGADEYHQALSGLFDRSVCMTGVMSDGGGALFLQRDNAGSGLRLRVPFYSGGTEENMERMVSALGGSGRINSDFALVFAGMPAACGRRAKEQLENFISASGFTGPVLDYRSFLGEYATVSASATVLACNFVKTGTVPGIKGGPEHDLRGKGILLLSLGKFISAVEILG
ncbi:MAG TPA: beta-ketoacyl-[acyl-carrier-protein] synthase family protein [Spirochaetota bacterium]|nr:beta-ketoacyl-[acyl-carrier-protein] synthase family protein [Spirochaetota bacterium]HPI87703.1 beta-ketoacyl-[acyl-carrier-protein] synthase family protein [Spirochaetota bacterium]HPR48172.1 beta-ketoacyl-[acyl-carrier-protein] synthase family protein [Spirochaetota bacterium]